jgi:hypothetical protein
MRISSDDTLPQYGSNVSTRIGLIELGGTASTEVMSPIDGAVVYWDTGARQYTNVLVGEALHGLLLDLRVHLASHDLLIGETGEELATLIEERGVNELVASSSRGAGVTSIVVAARLGLPYAREVIGIVET